jgi:hypothetical protein
MKLTSVNGSKFKLGERVAWVSSSNGSATRKVGTIVEVVPFKGRISTEHTKYGLRQEALPREHESYVVHVAGKTDRSAGKRYWPRVSALVRV